MKTKKFVVLWLLIVLTSLMLMTFFVVDIDPFFHYHKPKTDKYYYELNNERSQNDGIIEYFDYDAIIIGSSMIENSKTSEIDKLFGTKSIKIPFSGGTYKEFNDAIKKSLISNNSLSTIFRCIDMDRFFDHKDNMRDDLGEYPYYLYDDNIFNDVNYIYNKDILLRVGKILKNSLLYTNHVAGITSFDNYSRWNDYYEFGRSVVIPDGICVKIPNEYCHLTNEEIKVIKENVEENLISVAIDNPDVQFYYFFPPYSAVFWADKINENNIYKYIEAENIFINEILKCKNIKLYSFIVNTDITLNLNNYKDCEHYGDWINTKMLEYIKEDKYLITEHNVHEYLNEIEYYLTFDYSSLNYQDDFEGNDKIIELMQNID